VNILEERGLFWWEDEPVPENHFAPDASVAGLLTIEETGRAILDLDGVLPSEKGRWAVLHDQGLAQNRGIRGILKVTDQKVLLTEVFGAGGSRISTSAMSYQRFGAFTCLIGRDPITRPVDQLTFRRLEVPLDGFEEWLWLRSITRSGTRSKRVRYRKPRDLKYSSTDGTLIITHYLDDEHSGKFIDFAVSWREKASIEYRPKNRKKLEELKATHQLLGELLILLTDSDYPLSWPFVWSSGGSRYRYYFMRTRASEAAKAPAYYECCTIFPKILDSFGSIWSNWRNRREEVGAGVYLYLATRRGSPLYIEHRFVNLIVGIEAYHRQSLPLSKSAPLEQKIARIVEQVKTNKDRKWLKHKLAYAHEPSLKDRIFDLFKALPINLDRKRLRVFCKSCADLRNDVSHFGGPRPPQTYAAFLDQVNKTSNALSRLYHILLLQKTGVDERIIRSWVDSGWRSHEIKWDFVQVGLLDKEVLNHRTPAGL
jgi:hypothetical protein